jgi:hypothetical protein
MIVVREPRLMHRDAPRHRLGRGAHLQDCVDEARNVQCSQKHGAWLRKSVVREFFMSGLDQPGLTVRMLKRRKHRRLMEKVHQ